jgi:hypothetical protein
MLAAIKAVSDTHETCKFWPLRYYIKKSFPVCQRQAHQGPLNNCTSCDGTREFFPRTALRNNCPSVGWSSGSMRVRYVRKTGGCRDFFVSNSKMKIKTETPGFDVVQL